MRPKYEPRIVSSRARTERSLTLPVPVADAIAAIFRTVKRRTFITMQPGRRD